MENKDFLNGWREEVFGSYEGGSEYDPTVEAIKEYLRMEEEKAKKAKKSKKKQDEELTK